MRTRIWMHAVCLDGACRWWKCINNFAQDGYSEILSRLGIIGWMMSCDTSNLNKIPWHIHNQEENNYTYAEDTCILIHSSNMNPTLYKVTVLEMFLWIDYASVPMQFCGDISIWTVQNLFVSISSASQCYFGWSWSFFTFIPLINLSTIYCRG